MITTLLLVYILLTPIIASTQDFDSVIAEYIARVRRLEAKNVDTTQVVELINEAVEKYQEEDETRALQILGEVDSLLDSLERSVDQVYYQYVFTKAITVIVLALIPILVYTLLPRVYLYLWFKTRKRWIVREY
jgi:hypothetical protein